MDYYLRLGDVELVNAARTLAYTRGGLGNGLHIRDTAHCTTIPPWVEANYPALIPSGGLPAFAGYTTPDDADFPAPWYTPTNPHSSDFAGLLVESVDVTAPYARTPIPRTRGGGSLPGLIRQGRTVTVVAWLLGRTCCAIEYGYKWLNAVIDDNVTTVPSTLGVDPARSFLTHCGDCAKGDLVYFDCCPDSNVGSCGDAGADSWPAVDTFIRRMVNVGVIAGVEVLDRFGTNCGCGGCLALKAQFVLYAEDPYVYTQPVSVPVAPGWDGGIEATFLDAKTAVFTGGAMTSLTFNRPNYTGEGDLWVMTVTAPGNVTINSPTTPTPWVTLAAVTTGGAATDSQMKLFARYTTGSMPATITTTLSSAAVGTVSVVCWTDVLYDATRWAATNDMLAVADLVTVADSLTAPAIVAASDAGPAVYVGALRNSAAGNNVYTPPGGYTELVDVSVGQAGKDAAHEVAQIATGLGLAIPAAAATPSIAATHSAAAHFTVVGDTTCLTEWLITGTPSASTEPCDCDNPNDVTWRTPDCATAPVPPVAPVSGAACYCEGPATVRRCVQVNPDGDLLTGDATLRIEVAGSAASTRMVIRFYAQGVRDWDPDNPPACPGDETCPDWHIVIPAVADDETLIIDGMRRVVAKRFLSDDAVNYVVQVDAWVGTLDGTSLRWPDVCGPMCVCFDLDYESVTDADGALIALPVVTVDYIRREA